MSAKVEFYHFSTKLGWAESNVITFSRFGMTIVKSQGSCCHMNEVWNLNRKKKYVIRISSNIAYLFH
jgi:hypothetical protein